MLGGILLFFYPLYLYVFVLTGQYYGVLLERTNKDIIYIYIYINISVNHKSYIETQTLAPPPPITALFNLSARVL